MQDKVRENRLRRKLSRMGYNLSRSRRRDPDANDYGLYAIIDVESQGTVHAAAPWGIYTLTLDDVEEMIPDL
ncbi:hypothetical protein [Marispirochaeta aestuarii]|uniref:hypothetical protein n=1 Tax=Marispirochaeta aestuarii TaxID=1963862 RepID=UPI0029C91952|nr:hypothetical protein [Marispirochaeta aestuarii]